MNLLELQARAEKACDLAVGKSFTVRRWKDSNVTMTGIIVAAELAGFRKTPKRLYQLFKVTLESKNPAGRFEFVVDQLPR